MCSYVRRSTISLVSVSSVARSKTGPRILVFGFVAKHRFHFIVGRPRTHVISSLDFGSSRLSPLAMGVSALARRAAPANRARITGSLSSRRWPSAPPWRRPPTTSAALLRTLSSLGQPEVAGHSNGRAGQAASRLFPQRSEHVRPRVYTAHTRAAAHVHPRRPNRARSISAPPGSRPLGLGAPVVGEEDG